MDSRTYTSRQLSRQRGFSLFELLIVLSITFIVASFSIPIVLDVSRDIKLRSSAGDLAGLIQQARIMAAKNNAIYPVRYATLANGRIAYIDLDLSADYTTGEPLIPFSGTVTAASGAPSGSGGQPTPYTYTGDTGAGSFDNTTTLAFSPRGLPCKYDTSVNPPTCITPAPKYFVYYLNDTRPGGVQGWAAVVVTKTGRSLVSRWNGGIWH